MIQRVFQRLAAAFGRKAFDMWQGMDMQDVYADWADALQACSLGSIQYGIMLAKSEQSRDPPTQGQFLAMCKKYVPEINHNQLDHKLTPEQMEANKKRISEIAAEFARKNAV